MNPPERSQKPTVLVVDDSADDLMLVRMAAKQLSYGVELKEFDSGEEAVRYVRGDGVYSDRQAHPFPSVVILDLKMPRMDGFQVLRAFGELRERPFVVVMSSSNLAKDMEGAMALGATAFNMKPRSLTELSALLDRIVMFFCLQQNRTPLTRL